MLLTEEQFKRYLAFTRMPEKGKTAIACKMVLVLGKPRADVVKQVNISDSVLSRGLARLHTVISAKNKCPHCGGAL